MDLLNILERYLGSAYWLYLPSPWGKLHLVECLRARWPRIYEDLQRGEQKYEDVIHSFDDPD